MKGYTLVFLHSMTTHILFVWKKRSVHTENYETRFAL